MVWGGCLEGVVRLSGLCGKTVDIVVRLSGACGRLSGGYEETDWIVWGESVDGVKILSSWWGGGAIWMV